jgi:hypothetical protein
MKSRSEAHAIHCPLSTHKLPWQVQLQPDVMSFSSLISACGEGDNLYPAESCHDFIPVSVSSGKVHSGSKQ